MLRRYEEWYRKNAAWLMPLEEAARAMTVLVPGRFSTSELPTEALYTCLSLLSLYHDRILERNRVVSGELSCGRERGFVPAVQNVLTLVSYSQVLVEMVGRAKFPEFREADKQYDADAARKKWKLVAAVEAVKAVCRLLLLVNNGGRMLVQRSAEEVAAAALRRKAVRMRMDREQQAGGSVIAAAAAAAEAAPAPATASSGAVVVAEAKALSASGGELPRRRFELNKVPPGFEDVRDLYVLHGRVQHVHGFFSMHTNPAKYEPSDADKALEARPPSALRVLGEVLYWTRPVAYIALRVALAKDRLSLKPWLWSLLFDLLARAAYSHGAPLSEAQQRELSVRDGKLLFYLLRTPFFERYTFKALERVLGVVSRLPLLGSLQASALELVSALQSYHFYVSAS